ncbi:hypothetical protein ACFV7Q_38470 [Streptomyces sp. NPDC059851]|uniref:hypothetical protein n=1 Tax=Streptomyces sp. NPDC059851 TaxID=3346971 RepID=UPI003651F24B
MITNEDDAAVWDRLASMLSAGAAQAVRDCWAIGEQEAGLGMLVAGLLDEGTAISETARAELAVVAETWGERENLMPQLLRCRGDGRQADVQLIEVETVINGADLASSGGLEDLLLVPWVSCTRCGQVLMRAHALEPWGNLSYIARHYAIVSPDRGRVLRVFSDDSADESFCVLLHDCPRAEPAGQRLTRLR